MREKANWRVIIACGSMAVATAAGCGSLDLGGDNDSSYPPSNPSPSPVAEYGGIPRGARRVAQGYDTVRYRAERAGRIWVGNDTRRIRITEAGVRRGDEVVVDARGDRVTVNGQIVFDRNLEKSELHSVFFIDDNSDDGDVLGDVYGGIPEHSQRLNEGEGRLRVRVPADGRVWVGNDTQRFEVTSFAVKANDEVDVDVPKDRVLVNGQVLFNQNMESKHRHSVFFRQTLGGAGYGKIPADAERVASGTGTVQFRVETEGSVWVGDDQLKRELILHHVNRGDLIEVVVKSDQIKLNGKVIYNQNLESKHQHSVFFRPANAVEGGGAKDGTGNGEGGGRRGLKRGGQ